MAKTPVSKDSEDVVAVVPGEPQRPKVVSIEGKAHLRVSSSTVSDNEESVRIARIHDRAPDA
jgi:hypothetical protein